MPIEPGDMFPDDDAVSATRRQAREWVTFTDRGQPWRRLRYIDDIAAVNTAEYASPHDHLEVERIIADHLDDDYDGLQLLDAVSTVINDVEENIFYPHHQEPTFMLSTAIELVERLTEYLVDWQNGLHEPNRGPSARESSEGAHGAALLVFNYLMPNWVMVETHTNGRWHPF